MPQAMNQHAWQASQEAEVALVCGQRGLLAGRFRPSPKHLVGVAGQVHEQLPAAQVPHLERAVLAAAHK